MSPASNIIFFFAIGLVFSQPFLLSENGHKPARFLWYGFASEHSSSAISSFGHSFLCFSDSQDGPNDFDKVATVSVQKTDMKRGSFHQFAKVRFLDFHAVKREYLENQGRSLALFHLNIDSEKVARIEMQLSERCTEVLPYDFFKKNCTFYCIQFISSEVPDTLNENFSEHLFYLSPRAGLQKILKAAPPLKCVTLNRGKSSKIIAHQFSRAEISNFNPIQICGIGPHLSLGGGILHGNSFFSGGLNFGSHNLISGENDFNSSKISVSDLSFELSDSRLRGGVTLLDLESFRNFQQPTWEFSKIFKLGFDNRESSNGFQSGFYLRHSLLFGRGNDRSLRIALGPEIYLSSKDSFVLRSVVIARFSAFGLFNDFRALIDLDSRIHFENRLSCFVLDDIKISFDIRFSDLNRMACITFLKFIP